MVDDVTGAPVAGAEVAVMSAGGWYAGEDQERDANGFALLTDATGSARRLCRDNWLTGEESGLKFNTRRRVYPPHWVARVSAPGYHTSEPVSVAGSRSDAVQKVAERTHRIEVRIRLFRA